MVRKLRLKRRRSRIIGLSGVRNRRGLREGEREKEENSTLGSSSSKTVSLFFMKYALLTNVCSEIISKLSGVE